MALRHAIRKAKEASIVDLAGARLPKSSRGFRGRKTLPMTQLHDSLPLLPAPLPDEHGSVAMPSAAIECDRERRNPRNDSRSAQKDTEITCTRFTGPQTVPTRHRSRITGRGLLRHHCNVTVLPVPCDSPAFAFLFSTRSFKHRFSIFIWVNNFKHEP